VSMRFPQIHKLRTISAYAQRMAGSFSEVRMPVVLKLAIMGTQGFPGYAVDCLDEIIKSNRTSSFCSIIKFSKFDNFLICKDLGVLTKQLFEFVGVESAGRFDLRVRAKFVKSACQKQQKMTFHQSWHPLP
jgi:hypothetical protein